MATQEITCPMCGFKNRADAGRCRSCGAKVEALSALYTAEEEQKKRYQQEAFEWKWALAAFGVYLTTQALVLVLMPAVLYSFDPQGVDGLLVSMAVWFFGGIVVGIISPGKTFLEPAVGASLAVIPTISFLAFTTPSGFQPTLLAYIVGGMLGVMLALFGAFIGEKIQMTRAEKAKS
jgi:DNA-directed RNA polymerase subunit RPC12/RpoP